MHGACGFFERYVRVCKSAQAEKKDGVNEQDLNEGSEDCERDEGGVRHCIELIEKWLKLVGIGDKFVSMEEDLNDGVRNERECRDGV